MLPPRRLQLSLVAYLQTPWTGLRSSRSVAVAHSFESNPRSVVISVVRVDASLFASGWECLRDKSSSACCVSNFGKIESINSEKVLDFVQIDHFERIDLRNSEQINWNFQSGGVSAYISNNPLISRLYVAPPPLICTSYAIAGHSFASTTFLTQLHATLIQITNTT